MTRETSDVWFYPVCLNGRISEISVLSEFEFFATVPKPQASPDNDSGDDSARPAI